MAKDHSQRSKHFTPKNQFPIAGIKGIKDVGELKENEGVLILRFKGDSDTDRRTIKDSLFSLDYQSIKEDIASSVVNLVIYDTIADRDADPASQNEAAMSFVRDASGDANIGRPVWSMYVYNKDYVLLATEEDVVYSTDVPDSATAVATAGTIVQGQTTAGSLKGQTFSKFMDQMLFISNPTKSNNSCNLDGIPAGSIEDGTTVAIVMNGTYNPGTIVSADGSPNVDLTGPPNQYDFSNTKGYSNVIATAALAQSDTATSFVIGVETVTSTLIVSYDQGTDPYFDGSGNPSNIFDGDRGPGTSTCTSQLVGRRFAFYEGNDASFPSNSAGIRGGQSSFLSSSDTGSFSFRIDTPNVNGWFAVPQGSTVTVNLRESANADITGSFDITTVAVNTGGGTGPAVNYDLWTEQPRAPYTGNVNYDVTVT